MAFDAIVTWVDDFKTIWIALISNYSHILMEYVRMRFLILVANSFIQALSYGRKMLSKPLNALSLVNRRVNLGALESQLLLHSFESCRR